MSQKRKASPPHLTPSTDIYHSERIHDRESTFIAAYSPTLTVRSLQQLPEFASASHRMAAWRKPSAQRSIAPGGRKVYDSGHDDDGEKYAGKRLEKLLEDLQVEGALVVARWYGGVMLGPVRFTHMETCGRDAIRKSKIQIIGDEGVKRQKVGSAVPLPDRKKLEQVLAARDKSIGVLRGLLAEKLAAPVGSETGDSVPKAASPVKILNYSNMPITALERLEKARDATLAWLLQGINKAEAQASGKERSVLLSVRRTSDVVRVEKTIPSDA